MVIDKQSFTKNCIKYLPLLAVSLILLASFFFEHVLGYKPCGLCMMQRYLLGIMVLFSLLVFFEKLKTLGFIMNFIFSIVGIGLALRLKYLEYLHANYEDVSLSCFPSFEFLSDRVSIIEAFVMSLKGQTDCGSVVEYFMGVSISSWALIGFIGLAAFNLYTYYCNKKH